jgi:hypothetical protein
LGQDRLHPAVCILALLDHPRHPANSLHLLPLVIPCRARLLQSRTERPQSRASETQGQTENVWPEPARAPVQRFGRKPFAFLGFPALHAAAENVVLGRIGGGRATGIQPSPLAASTLDRAIPRTDAPASGTPMSGRLAISKVWRPGLHSGGVPERDVRGAGRVYGSQVIQRGGREIQCDIKKRKGGPDPARSSGLRGLTRR